MMNMSMKRCREAEFNSLTNMANCLILLSKTTEYEPIKRNFECKTCNRQFPSFQALGGHRASHKKPKSGGTGLSMQTSTVVAKQKSHECSICGVEFGIGQALGGHMRRHRVVMNEKLGQSRLAPHEPDSLPVEPVFKKPINSGRRVWCLDLNLTVMENDLEFEMGKMAHVVN